MVYADNIAVETVQPIYGHMTAIYGEITQVSLFWNLGSFVISLLYSYVVPLIAVCSSSVLPWDLYPQAQSQCCLYCFFNLKVYYHAPALYLWGFQVSCPEVLLGSIKYTPRHPWGKQWITELVDLVDKMTNTKMLLYVVNIALLSSSCTQWCSHAEYEIHSLNEVWERTWQ